MDIETIRAAEFVGALNHIAALTGDGAAFAPFSEYMESGDETDDTGQLLRLFRDKDRELVCDVVDDAGELDIVSTWSSIFPGAHFVVNQDEDGGWYVDVSFENSIARFVCEEGYWYVASYANVRTELVQI